MKSVIKWHGGKSYLASEFWKLAPKHVRYCEPFFGGGAMLFGRADDGEGCAEFVNDIHGELVNFWRTLQHKLHFEDFRRLAETTPLSKPDFELARKNIGTLVSMFPDARIPGGVERIKRAVWFFIINRQSRQGLGKDFTTPTSRLRRGMNEQVSAWLTAVEGLPEFHARLKRVEIRNQDAVEFIRELDSPDTFFYCDPPYLHETRTVKDAYQHEMTGEQHSELLATLNNIKGKFMLSGYPSAMYDDFAQAHGWSCETFYIDNKASGKKEKKKMEEVVWRNYC